MSHPKPSRCPAAPVHFTAQTFAFLCAHRPFDEISTILKSLPSVKDVVISVKSELFGVEWAKSDECTFQTYEGTCAGWKKKNEILMVK